MLFGAITCDTKKHGVLGDGNLFYGYQENENAITHKLIIDETLCNVLIYSGEGIL